MKTISPDTDIKRLFWFTLGISFLIRVLLAAAFPFTGDEVYYWDWGHHPSLVYYDQPPMVGWLLAPLELLSSHPLVMRLPALLISPWIAFLGLWTVRRLRPDSSNLPWLTGIILLLLPHSLLNIFITTDTPLLIFAALSTHFFLKTLETSQRRDAFFTGLFAGLGFQSKYFIVLWVAAFIPLLAFQKPSKKQPIQLRPNALGDLSFLLAGFLPFVFLHLALNSQECWINLVFNFVTRHKASHFNIETLTSFLGQQFYLLLPLAIGLASSWKSRAPIGSLEISERAWTRFTPILIGAVGIAAFGISALKQPHGLNWSLGQHFSLWLGVCLIASEKTLRAFIKPIALISSLHVILAFGLIAMPVDWLQGKPIHRHAVFFKHTDEVLAALRTHLPQGLPLLTNSYTLSSMVGWASQGEFDPPLLFSESRFGRNSDLFHDLAPLNGQDIAVFNFRGIRNKQAKKYFKSFERIRFKVRGATYRILIGRGFDFERYRSRELGAIQEKFYPSPEWLPCAPCRFRDRYFASEQGTCRSR